MEQIIAKPQLGFSEAINAATSKIFQFTGRSRRSEYWWTMLLVFLISLVLTPLVGFFFDLATIPLTFRRLHDIGRSGWWYGCCVILKVGFFLNIIFDIIISCVNADNLQGYEDEFGASLLLKYGLWWLAIFIYQIVLFIYQIVLFIFYCSDSEVGENDYGASPKYEVIEDSETEQE